MWTFFLLVSWKVFIHTIKCSLLGTILILCNQKDWVGGVSKMIMLHIKWAQFTNMIDYRLGGWGSKWSKYWLRNIRMTPYTPCFFIFHKRLWTFRVVSNFFGYLGSIFHNTSIIPLKCQNQNYQDHSYFKLHMVDKI